MDYLDKRQRRVHGDCNYSVISTLLMRYFKDKNIWRKIQDIAKKNDIKLQKNYSIIVLGISFFLYDLANSSDLLNSVTQIFTWIQQNSLYCIYQKYKNSSKNFKQLVHKKVKNVVKVLRRAFLNALEEKSEDRLSKILVSIYDRNGHKKTQEKNAKQLSKIILGVLEFGQTYQKQTCQNMGQYPPSIGKKQNCSSFQIPSVEKMTEKTLLLSQQNNKQISKEQEMVEEISNISKKIDNQYFTQKQLSMKQIIQFYDDSNSSFMKRSYKENLFIINQGCLKPALLNFQSSLNKNSEEEDTKEEELQSLIDEQEIYQFISGKAKKSESECVLSLFTQIILSGEQTIKPVNKVNPQLYCSELVLFEI